MTDFGKHDPSDPNQPPGEGQRPQGPPPGGGQPPQGPGQGGAGGWSQQGPPQQPQQGPQGGAGGWSQQGPPQQPQQGPQGGFPPPPQGNYGQPASAPPAGLPGGYPPAPMAPAGHNAPPGYYFHPESGLTLPVGTELASRGRRIGAFFLRFVLTIVTLGIGYLIWGAILWSSGTSPALKVLGMKCYKPADGQVPGWGVMALRNIVGSIVEGILSVITLLISFIMFLATGKRQSLHDVIGGTVVLYDPNKVLGG